MKSYQAAIIGFGVGATLLVWIGVVILLRQIPGVESKVMESELHGVLIPAEEPNPPHPCDEAMRQMSEGKPLTPNAVAIHFGNSAALLNEIDKFVVIQVGDEELLSVQEGKDGLSVSAKVFSADSRIVAQIVDNEFHVNPNNYFRISRPDRHSLVVYDQQATEVLNVHFLNPHLVTVLGVFRHPRARLITIRENAVKAGGMIISGSCSFDSPMGIQIGSSSN